LIDAYLARGESILLTHMTLNGRRTGKQLFAKEIASGQIRQVYLPYDICWAVEHFLKTFKPKLGLFMETEAWPTVVFRCKEIDLPLFLVNARLSERSARRIDRFGKAGRALFQAFTGILAQTEFDAGRYRSLGVKNIVITGPYIDEINECFRVFYTDSGFNVLKVNGLGILDLHEIGAAPPSRAYKAALEVFDPKADGVFIGCTNFRCSDVIEQLEQDLGKPVITSNQATAWQLMRLLGIDDPVEGYGELLRRKRL
jgi:hypothetical protein